MKELLQCRFLQTVMSGDTNVELSQLLADYGEFYSQISSLLYGDWKEAGTQLSQVVLLLKLCKEGKKRPAAYCN